MFARYEYLIGYEWWTNYNLHIDALILEFIIFNKLL